MTNKETVNIFWFRRDLRLEDNHGLFQALSSGLPVLPIFIFDKNILDVLSNPSDKRVLFIHQTLAKLNEQLKKNNSTIQVFHSTPSLVFESLVKDYKIEKVFTNRDYEPYALKRDAAIQTQLNAVGVTFETYKDHVVFECSEVVKDDGLPYTVFTPYSKKWKSRLLTHPLVTYSSEFLLNKLVTGHNNELKPLQEMGFMAADFSFPTHMLSREVVTNYHRDRDFPGLDATSKLGIHLRFGTVSIRKMVFEASMHSEIFLNELIWRDFYQMILWHFPHVGNGASFKKDYDNIEWRNNPDEFSRWKEGKTGYPIVDAGMRELSQTGFMHNRVRMITASFLTKHLLIDWRWGEAWFAEHLLDFDLASNNGGWQWAAGSGCDAAPYFRVFNPYLQTEKFDNQATYIRKWVPEFDTLIYPQPIVNHEFARKRCLETYAAALKK